MAVHSETVAVLGVKKLGMLRWSSNKLTTRSVPVILTTAVRYALKYCSQALCPCPRKDSNVMEEVERMGSKPVCGCDTSPVRNDSKQ